MEQNEIIAISRVRLDTPNVLQILIQLIQVQVPEPLARIVSYWSIPASRNGVDNISEQAKRSLAFDLAIDDLVERVMMD